MSKNAVIHATGDENTEKQLPFSPLTPNSETLAAMQEFDNDDLEKFETVEELFEDLNA